MAVIEQGDRVLIIDRKLFKDDNMGLFVGIIEEAESGVVRAKGFPFHLNPYEIAGVELPGDERVRLISLMAGDLIYLLPPDVEITKLQLRRSPKSLTLTDGRLMSLDLSEWLERL